MAPSIVEKYEQILAADPRSRVFVELARALVERGDHAKAMEVCRQGLTHHPSSILGRVTWGRALLLAGDARAALDQLEIAIGIDPANPYAYNLVGDAMVRGGLFKEALPVLTRAAELQPADPKARAALEDARRRAGGGTVPAISAVAAPTSPAPPQAAPAPAPPTPSAAPGATLLAMKAVSPLQVAALTPAPLKPAARAATARPDDASPEADAEPERTAQYSPLPADADKTEEMTLRLDLGPLEGETGEEEEQVSLGALDELDELDEAVATPAAAARPARPAELTSTRPPGPAGTPPVLSRGGQRGPPGPRTLLTMIPPGGPGAAPPGPAATPPAAADAAEAARIAAAYERELREQADHAAAQAPPPKKHHRALVAAVVLLVLGGATGAYLFVQERTRTQAAQRAVEAARAGLARDTRASLQKAAEVLAASRAAPPTSIELRGQLASLAAQVAALLAFDHGDGPAAALARELADDPSAGDGGLAARLLLAEKPAERTAAEATVLASRPGDAPLLQRLAGQVLVARGELESGRGRLRIATQATPPLLGALCDLGDSYLAAGDAEAALPYFEAAIAAHATHPRAVLGAAEARLQLERPLDGTRAELRAVEADAGSPPPLATRLRWEIVSARVLAASGEADAAARRLTLAVGSLGDSPGLEAARAGLLLDARAFEQAEEAAARAVRLEPRVPEHRILLARARVGLHRDAAALQALQGLDQRSAWLVRGLALGDLGQPAQARAALEKTMRNGKMPTEAATAYALGDLALGHADAALSLLEKLAAAKGATAPVHAAHGRALLAVTRLDEAEVACRRAVEKAPTAPEGPLCLGRIQLAAGRPEQAVSWLERAVALDRQDPEAARLLAAARAPPRPPPPKRAPAKAPAKPPARKR